MALPSWIAGEPVRTATVALVTASIALLVAFGVSISTEQAAAIGGFIVAVFVVAEALVRPAVTPLADPKTNDGTPLIPADQVDPVDPDFV